MLIHSKFEGYRRDGRRVYPLDFGGDAPPPPDYAPVAAASKEVAEIGAQLGREQLAEGQRQYEQNMQIAKPVVNAQLQVMQQGLQQGADYNAYQKGFRPLEQAMMAQVSGISAPDAQRLQEMRTAATNTSRTAFDQKQTQSRTQLQAQLAAELAREQGAVTTANTTAAQAAPTARSYVDADGNLRTIDSFTNMREGDATASTGLFGRPPAASPGEGYKYYNYDTPNPNAGDEFKGNYQGPTIQQGVWLKDQTQQAVAQAEATGNTKLADQLRQQLAELDRAQFDPNSADMSAVDAEQQRLTMAGMGAKQARDKAEIDAMTGEVRINANTLRDRTRAYEQSAARDIALATGGNQGIADKFAADIENDVGTAVADARVGQTQALNTAARQAARYGLSVPSNVQQLTNQNAATLAAASNNTRTSSINNYRNLVASGIGLKRDAFTTGQAGTADAMGKAEGATRAGRDMRIQQESLDFAKQLDVTGMARGMPGASQGAYGLAVSAGDSATRNQMAPGAQLQGVMAQSANTQLQGRQMALGGLSSVLNAQGQYSANASSGSGAGGLGSLLGGAASLYSAFGSDRRLKDDIELVGVDEATGLNLYEFSYIDDEADTRYVGVMAQEVQRTHPWAVTQDPDGNLLVTYEALGIEMKEVA